MDPNLGPQVAINELAIRNALRFAMQVGTPPEVDKRPKFHFAATGRAYFKNGNPVTNPRLDRDGVPLDPDIEVVETLPQPKTVDCAVEITTVRPEELPVGKYRPTKATLTVLDEQFAEIEGFKVLEFNGDRYEYDSEQYGLGLFGIGVHVIHCYAIDES